MNNILSEKEYQRYIIDELVNNNGYIERKATDFDRLFAIDREMLLKFLWDTQPDTMESLHKIYKDVLVYRNGYKLSMLDKQFITALCEAKRKYL